MGRFVPFYPLTSTFFGLNSDYKFPFLQEIYICMQRMEISYGDLMRMPTYERRLFIQLYREEVEENNERIEEANRNRSSGGKGTRSKTISGSALKMQIKNNQIPQ